MNERLRTIGSLGLIAVFGLTATGCSLGGTSNNSTAKAVQVRIWRTNQDVDPIRQTLNTFQNSNAKIAVAYTKKSLANYQENSLKSLASRKGPDIWSIPDDWLGDEEEIVQNLPDSFFKSKDAKCAGSTDETNPLCLGAIKAAQQLFPAGIVEQITSTDGTAILGMPTNVDTLQLYVNTSLLTAAASEWRKANPNAKDDVSRPIQQLLSKAPTTWNTLVSQAQYVTKRSGNDISRATIALGTADNISNSADILQLLMLQNGVRIVGTDRKRALFTETQSTPAGEQVRPGEKALDFYTSFANPSQQNYTWSPSLPSAIDAFGQGKVAMVVGFSDFGKSLKVKYPKLTFETDPVPQISLSEPAVNLLRFSVETVTQTADSTSAAFAFLKAYTDSSDTTAMASEQKLRSSYLKTLNARTDDYFSKQILTGQAVYKKGHADFDQAFRQMITDVTQNSVQSGTALDAAAQKINDLLTDTSSQ